jgi:hypothetical protein
VLICALTVGQIRSNRCLDFYGPVEDGGKARRRTEANGVYCAAMHRHRLQGSGIGSRAVGAACAPSDDAMRLKKKTVDTPRASDVSERSSRGDVDIQPNSPAHLDIHQLGPI